MAKKGFFSWFRKGENKAETNATAELKVEEQESSTLQDNTKLEQDTVNTTVQDSAEASLTKEATLADSDKAEPTTEEATKDVVEEKAVVEEKQAEIVAVQAVETAVDVEPITNNSAKPIETEEKEVIDSIAEHEEELIPEPQNKPGFFKRLMNGLKRTRENIGFGFVALFKGRKIDDDLFEDLETSLITADIGIETTQKIMGKLTSEASLRELKDSESLMKRLSAELHTVLDTVSVPLVIDKSKKPFVILMVGVNGVGKTTTIGKMAKHFEKQGLKVMLAAGDTFRAAAVEQLKVWGQRNKIPVVAQSTGSDSASVIYDALNSAKAKGYDVLIADTAGRLQNKANLMEELRKIVRVMKKLDPEAPHEVMLTLDAGTGQNAISQAKLFGEVVPLTGINLTKLDGTAKGGVIFNIADQFHVPIRFIGVGEGIDDLREFNADDFVKALFSADDKK